MKIETTQDSNETQPRDGEGLAATHCSAIVIEAVVQCPPSEAMKIAKKMALAGVVECHVNHVGSEGFVGIATPLGRFILPNADAMASADTQPQPKESTL